MFNPKFFDDISAKLNEMLANSPAKDFEKNARALLAQGFAKLLASISFNLAEISSKNLGLNIASSINSATQCSKISIQNRRT